MQRLKFGELSAGNAGDNPEPSPVDDWEGVET